MPSVFSSALPGVTGLSAPRWRLRLRHPLALGLFSVALLWLIWQIIAGSGWIDPLFLPAPQAVLAKLVLAASQGFMDATLWQHLAASLASTACGTGRNKGWIQPLPAAICQISHSSATLNKPSASG